MKHQQQSLRGAIKNVLIALVGTSPAVVTETINSLVKPSSGEAEFKPDRVVLITTSEGRARIDQELLNNSQGTSRWDKFVNDMGLLGGMLPEIRVSESHETDSDDSDRFDADAHSEPELDRMGALVFETIREWTCGGSSTTVCVSLSGGRKSMSHLAGTSLSLLGRAQDFLVHVIVKPEELEHCPDFYYKEPLRTEPYTWEDSIGGTLKSNKVEVGKVVLHLSRVPFVRLGNLPDLRERIDTFTKWGLRATIDAASSEVESKRRFLIFRRSQPRQLFLDKVDLTFHEPTEKTVLRSPQKIVAMLRMISRHGALSTSPDEAEMFDLFCEWRLVERVANVPFDAPAWSKRVSKHWTLGAGALQIADEDLSSRELFTAKVTNFVPGTTPFAGDISNLRKVIQRVPSITPLYGVYPVQGAGRYELLNLEFKEEEV